jgi:hypothetical protein
MSFCSLESLTKHRVYVIGELPGPVMSVAVGEEVAKLVKHFVFLKMGGHLGHKFGDVIGTARDETFGWRDDAGVGLTKRCQEVEISEKSSMIGRSKFVEKIEASRVEIVLQVGREEAVVQSLSPSNVRPNVSGGTM